MKWSMSEELAQAQRDLDERKLRHNAVVVADAVVSSAMSGIAKGFLWAAAFVLLLVIATQWSDQQNTPKFDRSILYKPLTSEQHDAEIRRQNDIMLHRITSSRK